MRFYEIQLTPEGDSTNPDGSPAAVSSDQTVTFTSHPNGQFDPGALNVDFDIPVYNYAAPMGNCSVTIHGVSLETIWQASNYNGATIIVRAGMAPGLPLATAAYNHGQQGIIAQGQVFQAFGNWIETDMTLDLIFFTNGGATQSDPANLTFNWPKGSQLGTGIQSVLQNAYPGWTVNLAVDQSLTLTESIPGVYQTIEQFAQFVNSYSKTLNPSPDYNGIDITPKPGQIFHVQDGTQLSAGMPTQLLFQDLIGQPTWVGPNLVSFYTVMRADLGVSDLILFPPAQTTSTAAEQGTQPANKASFSGVCMIQQARHVGDYRDPNGESWVTAFQAITPSSETFATADLPDAEG